MKRSGSFERTASTLTTYAVVGGGIYLTVQGVFGIERWMKEQELRDIEEERELTGQYISVDAGDVDTSIDPRTGKNLTIVKRDAPSKSPSNATAVSDGEAAPAPWILRVLGLGGSQQASSGPDDDDFWTPPTAASAPKKDPSSGGGGGEGGAPGGEGGEGGDGGDGMEDDTSGLDSVSDLLG